LFGRTEVHVCGYSGVDSIAFVRHWTSAIGLLGFWTGTPYGAVIQLPDSNYVGIMYS
jgi:hypothetical protein